MTQQSGGWAEKVIKGGEQKILQPRLFLYAPAGVGKSTFGSKLPKPIFVDFDRGIDDVNVDRIEGPKTWETSLALIRDIAADPRGYKSLVVDTVDPLEEMAVEYVLKQGNKEDLSKFDFGAGYTAVQAQWKLFLAELDTARKNGMLICLLGHAIVRQAQDPQLGSFDQFTSQLAKKTWALTLRWSDAVFFAAFDSALVQKKGEETRVTVTGDRFLFTVRGSGYEAKNRFSMPSKLPLAWPAVQAAIARHRQSFEAVRASILKLAAGTSFEEKSKAYLVQAGDDLNALLEIEEQLLAKLQLPEVVPAEAPPAAPSPVAPMPPPVQAAPAAVPPPVAPLAGPAGPAAPATPPSPGSPETIELRISELARGTVFEDSAKEYVAQANKDITTLLQIEERLNKRLSEIKAQAAPAAAAN